MTEYQPPDEQPNPDQGSPSVSAANATRPDWYRQRRVLTAISVLLLVVAASLVAVVSLNQHHAPRPPRAQATPTLVTAAPHSAAATTPTPKAPTAPATASTQAPSLGTGSQPIHISVPSIGVQSNLLLLGLNDDRTIEVPPLNNVGEAGWYEYSPTPGAIGPAIILGHIDSAIAGRGIFYNLGNVRQADHVIITRADHRTATFTVTSVQETPKSAFPTQQVYGNTTNSQLRLITCGGRFDSRARSYLDNIIVFATLISLTP